MKHTMFALLLLGCGSSDVGSDPDASAGTDGGTTPPVQDSSTNGPDASAGTDSGQDGASTGDAGPDGSSGTSVRFVAMGDTGKANTGQSTVAAAIVKKCMADGCDFVQLLGDNIYDSGVSGTMDPQWQSKFEMPYANVNLDFYAVLGNHDYGGGGAGNEFGKGQHQVDYSKVSKKWKMPGRYWHRAIGTDVEFFGLDTNMMIFFQTGQQKTDVPNWIKASKATWKIAMGHHPYLSNGPHGNAGYYDGVPFHGSEVKSSLESMICGKVDLYLCGHDHDRQWMKDTCKGTELIISGAGASTTSFKHNQPVHYQDDKKNGFVYIKIEGKKLTAEFIDEQGTLDYTRTITKP